MIPVFRPSLGKEEVEAVAEVIKSNWIGSGPKTREFEERFLKFIGSSYGVAVNSASAALHLAFLCSEISKGDEVVTPSLTFVATNHPILMVGATPVFCDVDPDTLCADPKDIAKKITKKTKAIVIVHYGGHPVDMDPIIAICKEKKIILIEDCAHAEGTYYKGNHVGTFGDFACFSFAAIKNMTTGDGGMLVGKEKKTIDRARVLAWSGISQTTWERVNKKKFKWQYDVISVGWKYQMNDIAAAIGLVQLGKLYKINQRRKSIAERYDKTLKDISWLSTLLVKQYATSAYHNYIIKVDSSLRDRLSDYLSKKNISTTVHYLPTHYYDLYKSYKADVPVTNVVWKEILLLPMFPDLTTDEQDYIIAVMKEFQP